MDAVIPTPGLSELRRELEEILALVSRDVRDNFAAGYQKSPSTLRQIEPDVAQSSMEQLEPPDLREVTQNDELFDDALVVITEFGQASPAILQMWLSIDYARAALILGRFEAQGLVSAKGRVRHKAYELRRTKCMEFRL